MLLSRIGPRMAFPGTPENPVHGDVEFNVIVRDFGEKVFNHALRILGNREEAEEACQDVFVRISRSLGGFRGDARISTWIWRITVNVCLNRREKMARRGRGVKLEEFENSPPAQDCPTAEDELVGKELRERLAAAISRLPTKEAAAITLFYMEDLDYAGIASALQVPPGSVATLLHRGRVRLQRIVAKLDEEND